MSDNLLSNKRIAKNSIFLSIRMVIVLAITLYTTRVLLQVLGVVDYGVYNVVCGFVLLFGFLNTSMSNGIQRFFNYEYGLKGEEGAKKVYCTSVIIQIILAAIVVILIESFGLWYLHNKMVIPEERLVAAEWIFQFSIVSFVFGILQAPYSAAVTAHERFDFYAIISVIDAVLKLLFVLLLRIVPQDKLILYGLSITIVSLLNYLVYYVFCKIKFNEISFALNFFERPLFKKMLGFSGWNLFGSLSGVMEVQGINLVLNFFYGPVVNAARGVATQVNAGVLSFVGNITTPVRPQVTQSYAKGEIQRTISLTYSVSKLSSAIILMLSIPACVEINYLLNIWLGDSVPDHAATFTILVLATQLVNSLNTSISHVVHATGIMKDYQLWGSIIRLCSIPTAIILIKIYALPELALFAVLICSCFAHIVGLFIVRKLVSLSLTSYMKEVAWPVFLASIIGVILVWLPHYFLLEGILRLLLVCICSLLVVSLIFYYLVFDNTERKLVSQLLGPIISRFKIFN